LTVDRNTLIIWKEASWQLDANKEGIEPRVTNGQYEAIQVYGRQHNWCYNNWPENCENRNDPDLVQAFLKKWWVESDFKAPNLPLSLRLKVSGCHYNSIYNNTWTKQVKQLYLLLRKYFPVKFYLLGNLYQNICVLHSKVNIHIYWSKAFYIFLYIYKFIFRYQDLVEIYSVSKWWVESDFKAPNLPLSLRLKVSGCHYNSIYNNTRCDP
jgi:hypothetical protein